MLKIRLNEIIQKMLLYVYKITGCEEMFCYYYYYYYYLAYASILCTTLIVDHNKDSSSV